MKKLLCQLGNMTELEECIPLTMTKYWTMDANLLTKKDLDHIHRALITMLGENTADTCMYFLMSTVIREFVLGDFSNENIIDYILPLRPITREKFETILNALTFGEKRALIFALLTDNTLSDASSIPWIFAWLNTDNQVLKRNLETYHPSSFFPFAFWNIEPGTHRPTQVEDIVRKVPDMARMDWDSFKEGIYKLNIDIESYL